MTDATIQAVETGDETIYVLRRPGLDPISAYWPHPLLELEPGARRLPMVDHHPGPRSSIPVPPSYHRAEPLSLGIPMGRTADHQRVTLTDAAELPDRDSPLWNLPPRETGLYRDTVKRLKRRNSRMAAVKRPEATDPSEATA